MNNKDIYNRDFETANARLNAVKDRAYRCLRRREHSAYELRQKLKGMAEPGLIEQIIARLQKRGEQSDLRYADMLCRSRFNRGKGPVKILQELKEHHIDNEIIERAMAEYEGRWSGLAVEVRIRKFGSGRPKTFKEWAKQAKFLQQRGFDSAHIAGFDDSLRNCKMTADENN